MKRLTTNKSVSEMNMLELVYNSCYTKDGWARYRDYEKDIDAKELARDLLKRYADGHGAFLRDEDFMDQMANYTQSGPEEIEGLIAVFYRNVWAMADLREWLKYYEDLEEQGKMLRLPCAPGDTVYTNASMQGWHFRKGNRPYEAEVVFVGINGSDNFMNVDFGSGHMLQFKFSDIGKTVFLTKEEAVKALKIDNPKRLEEGDTD